MSDVAASRSAAQERQALTDTHLKFCYHSEHPATERLDWKDSDHLQ